MEKISIIVPVFNIKLNEFNDLKNSLVLQTIGFENIEIIFLDNNSTYPFSKNFIQTFRRDNRNVKCILLNETHDISSIFIRGLDYVSTDYVMFLNYHDLLSDNACEVMYNKIFKSGSDIVIANGISKDETSLNGFANPEEILGNVNLSSRVYRTDLIKKISFKDCNSLIHFNYLISSSSDKIGFLNEDILLSANVPQNNFIINTKKLNILKKIVNKQYSELTIAIKSPNPISEKHWGDYFFAQSLKKSFQKMGFNVIIQEREHWGEDEDNIDIVFLLRGLIEYNPKPDHLNLMWNISHPDEIALEEYEKYDFVFIASKKYAELIDKKISTPVIPLLQCTDPEVFFTSQNEVYAEEILFVGITRNVFRKIIKDVSQTNHDFSVYGFGWDAYLDEKHIKGDFIPNNILNQAYSSCKILLNDHWDDMLKNDFPSNRLFDALACGTFVISDNIGSAGELFEGSVVTYDSVEDLDEKIEYYLKNESERQKLARKGQEIVLQKHTFDNRVDEILKALCNYDFNNFICSLNPYVSSLDTNENNHLRVIIIDNNDSKFLIESIDSILTVSPDIPVSVINFNDFSKNKFVLNDFSKDFLFDSLNEIIKSCRQDYILIIESGDILKKDILKIFDEMEDDCSNVGAVILDDYSLSTNEPNCRLGFSWDLYLETDYINYSALLNRDALVKFNGFDKAFQHNFIRNFILNLYHEGFEILKKDIIAIGIRNNLKLSGLKENMSISNKFLIDTDYEIKSDEKREVFPVYATRNKKASIIIPFKDQVELTRQCIKSILEKTDYPNYEIILINNNSYENQTFEFLSEIGQHDKCRVIEYNKEFNWSKINNYASTKADGDVLVFLNNDTEVISSDWLALLVGDAIQPGIAAVGSKLLYPDDTIQHAGVVVGLTYLAGHIFAKEGEANIAEIYNMHRRNVSAVTGACIAFKKETFDKIGRFDEDFEISFSDVEICLRAMEMGYRNIFNPRSILYHHEMKSRGTGDFRDIDRILAYNAFEPYFKDGDPFFNENYSLNYYHLPIKKKDEIPNYETFWNKFVERKESHLKSIMEARNKMNLNPTDEILKVDLTKEDLVNNKILMKNFSKNPNVNLNNVLWFLPRGDINPNTFDSVFRFCELMSVYENVCSYFVYDDNIFENHIKNNFAKLNFSSLTIDELEHEDMTFDAAFCLDWFGAYNLVKFNSCDVKFYFLTPHPNDNHNLTNRLIEQSYNFNFIGLTDSLNLLSEYEKFNSNIKYFNPTVNRDIFFPFPDEKSDRMTIVFQIDDENDKAELNLLIDVLKVIHEYFGDKVNLIVMGSEINLNQYDLNDVVSLGKITSDMELANIYRRANVCLMYSFDELSSQSALKCMACGCAIMTIVNSDNEWLVKQKENAILTEPNLSCIVEDLINLINDFKLRQKIVDNGFKTADRFDEKEEFLNALNFIKKPYGLPDRI